MDSKMLEKAKTAKSVEELLEMAKAENIKLSQEQAKEIFERLGSDGELSDEELDSVSGGCGLAVERYYCKSCGSYDVEYSVGFDNWHCRNCRKYMSSSEIGKK